MLKEYLNRSSYSFYGDNVFSFFKNISTMPNVFAFLCHTKSYVNNYAKKELRNFFSRWLNHEILKSHLKHDIIVFILLHVSFYLTKSKRS